MNKYEYLRPYINFNQFDGERAYNWFEPIEGKEIDEAEKRLGYRFPQSLKEFWLEIGRGSLPNPINLSYDYVASYNNHILGPSEIADIILLRDKSEFILPEVIDYNHFKDGDIPFFEITDMSHFLVMKSYSNKPNAIYDSLGSEIIEENFERLIRRLYCQSPTFYLDVECDTIDCNDQQYHSKLYTSMKIGMIIEWEQNTKQEWPRYKESVGKKRPGDFYDVFHIIPTCYGGPLTWSNIHPVRAEDHKKLYESESYKEIFDSEDL